MQTKRGKVTSSFLLLPKSSESDLEALEFDDLDMLGDSERTRLVEAEAPTATRPTSHSCSEAEEDSPNMRQPKSTVYVWQLAAFAAIGGFLFGYDTGVVSGAMLLLRERFHLSSFQQELVVSVTIGACCVSALLGGVVTDRLGRKPVTLLASFVFTAGAVVLGVAQNVAMLVAGRCILGIGIGLASMSVPIYIAECSPPHIRGRMVTINVLFITGGQFIASVLDGAFSYLKTDGWRYMLGLAAIPSFIQFFGFLFLPESPRWLMLHGREERARAVLVKLRGSEDVEDEIKDMQRTSEENRAMQERDKGPVIVRVFKTPHVRRAVFVGCGLQFFQQMVGINTVMYYSASIIKMAGISDQHTAIWLSAMTAGVNFVFTLVGVWLVERLGRRKLIIGSIFGVMLSLVVLAVAFQLAAFHSPPLSRDPASSSPCAKYSSCEACIEDTSCGYCFRDNKKEQGNGSCLATDPEDNVQSLSGSCNSSQLADGYVWAYEYCPTPYSWIAILGLVLYLMFFAPGMGPMPWTINSEIYPLWARSTGNALSASTNWIFNLVVAFSFLTLTETLTKYGTYWLFVGITFLGLLFFIAFVPETKGRKLEEVEELFKRPWCGRQSKSPSSINLS